MTVSSSLRTISPDGNADWSGRILDALEEVTVLSTQENVVLNDVLRLVGRRLCELLNVSRCSVYLRRDDGRFQGQVGYSVARPNIDAGVSKLVSGVDGDLFTAEILQLSQPVVVHDAPHDPRTIQKTMRLWGVRDMLGVPLVVEDEVIGIIYVDDQGRTHDYGDHEIKVAQAFAGLSALAVRQAWLFAKLAERSNVIDRQRRILGESSVVHERVTRAVLNGDALETILHVIATLLGKPVVLYSPTLRVVHWTAPDGMEISTFPGLTPAQAHLPHVERTLAQLDDQTSTIILRATPELRYRRVVAKLVADDQCLGYIELCEMGKPLSPVDTRALSEAAMAVSLKLLSEQRRHEAVRRELDDYLSDLLYRRRDLESLAARAGEYGLNLNRAHVIVRVQYAVGSGQSDFVDSDTRRQHLQQRIESILSDVALPLASTGVPGADVLLLEVPTEDVLSSTVQIQTILSAAMPGLVERFGARAVVVSDACRSISDLSVVGGEVRELAELLVQQPGQPDVVAARDLTLLRLVAQSDGLSSAFDYATRLLRPLRSHDQTTGSDLAETLQAFINHDAQVKATAQVLGVHENTVRYRLRRIQEISTIDPERIMSLAAAHLAFQIQAFRHSSACDAAPSGDRVRP